MSANRVNVIAEAGIYEPKKVQARTTTLDKRAEGDDQDKRGEAVTTVVVVDPR